MLGEDSTRIFHVEIDSDNNVVGLAIKEKKPLFDHITADSLDVWSVSIPIDEDANLVDKRFGVGVYAARGTNFVGECFDPYASWKRSFFSLFFSQKNLTHHDRRL